MLVLEELQKKWRDSSSSTEGRLLGDKLAAMETKCEQLEEKLADARSEVNNSSTSVRLLKSKYCKIIVCVGLTYKRVSLATTTWRYS